ncbi:vWA domain-containing protein [Arenibaculum pallidiluteum]|uniref:vWA domain-containing protein n=1 Tax=Arenibaculum pallidiluteum TaxID=2812559 RepID=UPI001A97A3D8|nr:VWA domain-containing protein [Arenibaculum pallidiluteum]
MFTRFFYELRQVGVPVSLREYLTLLEAMKAGVAAYDAEGFYYLARAALVKDERHLDRFDQVFAAVFKGLAREDGTADGGIQAEIPADWLRRIAERILTEEEKRQVQALGGWDKLMETLAERLAEQRGRHQGGSKWIGTGGTSPFGAYGYNPEGLRIGQDAGRNRRAVKVWDRREFRNLDDGLEIGTRNIKVALRRLRRFARTGAADVLDLDGTVRATASNAGWLDLKLVPERRNSVKVLLFLDVGGSMDDHVRLCEELFSAARAEFKHLEHFYFHNCVYESVWRDNRRRGERIPTLEVLRTYGADYRLVIVGDAAMSPYEIVRAGGSVEHWNDEPGQVWLQRLLAAWEHAVWLNPTPQRHWDYTESTRIVRRLVADRMFPLTIEGLDRAMRALMTG